MTIILQSTVVGFSAEFMRRLPELEQAMVAHGLEPSQFVISKDRATPATVPVIGPFLHIGIWPLIMGVTMWAQMKLNPAPPDPTQKMIFDWMPLIFTFMLAGFSAGLVIYWAWNNSLSVLQQSVIMRKNGAKIELFDNIVALFGKKPDKKPDKV